MARKLIGLFLVLGIAAMAAFWFVIAPKTEPADAFATPYKADLANGKTMFDVGGCVSCHTDSKEDRTRLGGGVALGSPFGTFYTPNISPDPDDGIGRWSEAQFVSAMRYGTSPQGTHLYPSFPYASYQRMNVDDVRDLFAYIKTLPAVKGRARGHDLPFPFNIRLLLGGWKLLYLDDKPFTPDPSRDAQWNRGAYLVNGPGHCAECHSPRDMMGGIVAAKRFAGGPNPEGEGFVPNITQQGLGSWSDKDIAEFLKSGMTPEFDSAGGSMAAVIRNTAQLSDADRLAMAVYIKSLPAVAGPPRPAKK
ncbi:c-type cytochrome [Undibacter mobilis]|uniref:Alkylated DNA repair protein n=1 Tax=Undibacter mobilis TaxID=2292256 RepID=A0A371BC31_9BRAD|nr:cytochrome c [Undibacter mobilis]RDV05122.1 alkylated DNA repair protein [Undibacter mobilis]